jgi:hypothetical protein
MHAPYGCRHRSIRSEQQTANNDGTCHVAVYVKIHTFDFLGHVFVCTSKQSRDTKLVCLQLRLEYGFPQVHDIRRHVFQTLPKFSKNCTPLPGSLLHGLGDTGRSSPARASSLSLHDRKSKYHGRTSVEICSRIFGRPSIRWCETGCSHAIGSCLNSKLRNPSCAYLQSVPVKQQTRVP